MEIDSSPFSDIPISPPPPFSSSQVGEVSEVIVDCSRAGPGQLTLEAKPESTGSGKSEHITTDHSPCQSDDTSSIHLLPPTVFPHITSLV